jgi:hypothetical protein
MRFDDLNWQDVASYLEQNDRIILVTGSTEHHAFLSLTTDKMLGDGSTGDYYAQNVN